MMTRYHILLLLLVVTAGSLTIGLLQNEPSSGHGIAHPLYPSMSQGGDSSRHDDKIVVGWIYGSSQLMIFVGFLTLGVKLRRPWSLTIMALGFVAVFAGLMWNYGHNSSNETFFFGFHHTTAWLVYGVWPASIAFVALYVIRFKDWIYNPNDSAKFNAIMNKKRISDASRSDAGEARG